MKREYKIIQSNIRRKQGEFCELTYIHFLINIKSNHHWTSLYKNKEVIKHLRLIKNAQVSNNGDVKFWLKRKFPYQLLPSKINHHYGESVRNKETRGLPF